MHRGLTNAAGHARWQATAAPSLWIGVRRQLMPHQDPEQDTAILAGAASRLGKTSCQRLDRYPGPQRLTTHTGPGRCYYPTTCGGQLGPSLTTEVRQGRGKGLPPRKRTEAAEARQALFGLFVAPLVDGQISPPLPFRPLLRTQTQTAAVVFELV